MRNETVNNPDVAKLPARFAALAKVPQALFSCSNKCCQPECSYPANMLHWYEKERRWVCEHCWDELDYENEGEDRPEKGMSLETYIVQNRLMAAEILHNDQAERRG